jgi:hypothetical protein
MRIILVNVHCSPVDYAMTDHGRVEWLDDLSWLPIYAIIYLSWEIAESCFPSGNNGVPAFFIGSENAMDIPKLAPLLLGLNGIQLTHQSGGSTMVVHLFCLV